MNCEQSNIAFDKIENFFFSFFHVENAFQNRKKPKSIKLFSIFFFQKDSPIKPKKKTILRYEMQRKLTVLTTLKLLRKCGVMQDSANEISVIQQQQVYVVKYIFDPINAMFRRSVCFEGQYVSKASISFKTQQTLDMIKYIAGQIQYCVSTFLRDFKRKFRSLASAILNCHVDLYVLNAISMKTSILFGGSAYFNNDKKTYWTN